MYIHGKLISCHSHGFIDLQNYAGFISPPPPHSLHAGSCVAYSPPTKDNYVFVWVCLFICVHDYSKNNECTLLVFWEGRAWPQEEVIELLERSGIYPGYKKKSWIFTSPPYSHFSMLLSLLFQHYSKTNQRSLWTLYIGKALLKKGGMIKSIFRIPKNPEFSKSPIFSVFLWPHAI